MSSGKSKLSGIQKRLLKASTAAFGMRVYAMAINLALHSFLAHQLPPEDYGVLVVAINTLMFVSTLGMGGLNQSILKFVAGNSASSRPADKLMLLKRLGSVWVVATSVVCVGGWLLLSVWIGRWLSLDSTVVALVFACGAALSLEQILAVTLRSLHAMPSASLLDGRTGGGVSKTVMLAACFAMVVLGVGLSSQFCLVLLGLSLLSVTPLGFWLLRRAWRGYVDTATQEPSTGSNAEQLAQDAVTRAEQATSYQAIVHMSGTLLVTQVLVFLITRSDVWLAGGFVSKDDTALYTGVRWLILQTIAPLQILNVAISSSIAQLYAEGRKRELESMLRSSSTFCALVTLPVLAVLAIFNQPILGLIYTDFYKAGGTILVILAIGQAVNCLTGNSGQTLVLSGKIGAVFSVNLLAAILQIVAGWWSIRNHGIYGLAVSTTVVTIVQCIAIWLLARVLSGVWTHPTLFPVRAFKSMK